MPVNTGMLGSLKTVVSRSKRASMMAEKHSIACVTDSSRPTSRDQNVSGGKYSLRVPIALTVHAGVLTDKVPTG
jgi:hypothetical protein